MSNVINGLHVIVDGTTTDPGCFNAENLHEMLLKLVEVLDMQLILGPIIKNVDIDPEKLTGDSFRDEGGVSAFCMISKSHISIHCWPLRKTFMADLFSCDGFDGDLAVKTLKEYVNADKIKYERVWRSIP